MSRARMPYFSLASTTIERPSGVSSASEASCAASASSCSVTPRGGQELGRLAVAEGDRAGLVEQQRVDVAGRFHRAARHGEHVEAHQPVHAGDADGRQQRADGGRDQRDEQRHQHERPGSRRRHRRRSSGSSRAAKTKMSVRPASRMLSAISFGVFWRSAPSTSAIMRSMKVAPGAAVMRTLDPVGQDLRAAGDRRAVAAGLADDRARIHR